MFEEISKLQEFAQCAKRHLITFVLATRWVVGGLIFLSVGHFSAYGQFPELWNISGTGNWLLAGNWIGTDNQPGVIPTNATAVTVNNGGTAEITSGNALALSLTIDGGSTVESFGGTLTVSGPITIGAGGRILFTGGTVFTSGFQNNGVIQFDSNLIYTDPVSSTGSGKLIISGTGSTILTASNAYTGGTTISSGALQVGSGGTSGSIVGDVVDDGVLSFDRSDAITFGGAITGAGDFDKLSANALTLTGNNTYTGGTNISAGTLVAGSTTAFSLISAFTLSVGTTLDLNGFNNTIGSLSGSGFVLNNGQTAAGLTVGQDNTSSSFNGVLKDGTSALQLTKIGTGTLTLTGANSYTGATTLSAGTLAAGSTTAFSSNSAFTLSVGTTLDLNGFNNTIGSLSGSGFVLNNGQTAAGLTVGQDNTSSSFNGVLKDGTNALQLIKIGSGTLTLTGANSYTGGTTIGAGALQISNGGSIVGVVTNNGNLDFQAASGGNLAITNNGGTAINSAGGLTQFSVASSAASATITNNAGTVGGTHGGETDFEDTSTAANATITNNGGFNGAAEGLTKFLVTSTAANATITNEGGDGSTSGGFADFLNSSTAGNATIINNGSATSGGRAGLTGFGDTSSAGNATITNEAATVSGAAGGSTEIANSSNAGNAIIKNIGATVDGAAGGLTEFLDSATAQNAAITNFGAVVGVAPGAAGITEFFGTATGGNATITNFGGTDFHLFGGLTEFFNGSTAGNATINNMSGGINNGFQGQTTFLNQATAGNATITNNGGDSNTLGGSSQFQDQSTAGSAKIINNGGVVSGTANATSGGFTNFLATSNAGSATITNGGGTAEFSGGATGFFASSTAANASITNNGGGPNADSGGFTDFSATSTAGSATITNNGGSGENFMGGVTQFLDTATAGNATIITNGGTSGGAGGITYFFDNSDGGVARAITNGNGRFDISGLTTAGMGIGSIEGSGNYFLGSKTLTVGGNNLSTTVAGVIQDGGIDGGTGGSLIKVGTGTLALAGTNIYTGGTTINGGTLQIGDGGTTGSIAGNVVDNATLAFNRSDSITFGGVVSGAGNVVKLGTGTLTLTNANTYTGSTTINTGSLIVDGSTMSAQTVVNSGAFLGGHGTIGGNLINSGTISQINSPGTLKVTGDYTQNPGGTLRIGVAGVATGQHDLLAVNGHATLGGTLQLVPLGGFSLQPGNQITFLTANKGVSGTFNNAQNGLVSTGTVVLAQITTTSDSAVLVAAQGSFADTPGVATNPNNVAVAKALDSARGDPREAALFAFLNSQPLANLPHDLTLIAPTQVTSINATAVSVSKVQVSNVGQRLANIRGGSNGFSSAGFSISGGAASIGDGFAGVSGPEGKSGPAVFAPTPDNRWGVFVTGLGEFSNVDSTPDAAGYDVNTGGVTFGVDYRLTPNFALGVTGGYAHTSVGLDGGGNIDVNGGKLGLYATLFGNGFYLDAAATGGPSGYNTRRTALQGTASGSTDGADFNTLIAVGYDWTKGNLSIGPTASFQYSYIGLNSFTETGSLAPLKFPDQNTESERSAFGAKATYQWKVSHVTVIPQVSAAWQHEYGDTAYSIVSGFASGAGKSFTVTGPDIGRDSILVGAGATVIWNERVSTYLYYDGEFARTNYLSNNVSGGVRISF